MISAFQKIENKIERGNEYLQWTPSVSEFFEEDEHYLLELIQNEFIFVYFERNNALINEDYERVIHIDAKMVQYIVLLNALFSTLPFVGDFDTMNARWDALK